MHRGAIVFGLYLSFAIALGAACGTPAPPVLPSDDDSVAPRGGTNSAGTTANGGTTGGTVSNGGTGTPATGGTVSNGGSVSTGGSLSSGGMPGAGRASTSGGTTGVAGRAAGGSAGTVVATGGSVGTAGTGTGVAGTSTGSAGTSSGTVACDAAFAVGNGGFVRMPAKDGSCWHGYAFDGGDTGSTVMPTDYKACMSPCSLTAMGTVGAATEANMYSGTVFLGFSVGEAAGGGTKATVIPTGTGIIVTATAPAGARVQLQATGGDKDATKRWCATLTSGTAIPYTMFNTACWDNSGVAYAKSAIEAIQIVVPGADAAASFTIGLTSVKEM